MVFLQNVQPWNIKGYIQNARFTQFKPHLLYTSYKTIDKENLRKKTSGLILRNTFKRTTKKDVTGLHMRPTFLVRTTLQHSD